MKVQFSEHAVDQIKRRNIIKYKVVKVVENPTETFYSFRGRELLRAKIDGKLLEVVIKREEQTIVVITAYYLEDNV